MPNKIKFFDTKFFLGAIIIMLVTVSAMAYVQINNIELHDTGLFTGVRFSATNNAQVQLADRRNPLFGDTFFNYYDLPYTVNAYGNRVTLQYWFKERYNVNGTFEEYMHGPFSFSLSSGSSAIIIKLNQNNVTVSVIE